MAWEDYRREFASGIEETERVIERSTEALVALLLLLESRLKRRALEELARLPRRGERWDLSDRGAVRRARARITREVEATVSELRMRLGGTRSEWSGRVYRSGFQWDGMQAARRAWDAAYGAAMRQVRADVRRLPPPPETPDGGPAGPEAPPDPRLDPQARSPGQIKQAVAHARERGASDAELEDLKRDGLLNILRWSGVEVRRFDEELMGRVVNRYAPAREAFDFILGPDGDKRTTRSGDGWRINRNNLTLSTVAHIRAVHRRATVAASETIGITNFRLDVPKSRLGRIAPDGLLGRELWRVRPLDEWLDVQRRANAGRVGSSTWDTLGLGYGDVSYIVPVPWLYLAAATATGLALRERWMNERRAAA